VDGKLVLEPEEAHRLRGIFTWYMRRKMGAADISRELNHLGVKPRKGDRWKATRVLKVLCNPLCTGVIRWGGETVQGMHEAIFSQETFDAVQEAMQARRRKGRSLQSPNVLNGLVRRRLCGAPMHVTYSGDRTKSRLRYYVCDSPLSHQSCEQDYIRADIFGGSVLAEPGKPADRREVVSDLVREFTTERRTKLPELESRREAARMELARIQKEREKLTRWVLSAAPNPRGWAA
jgi:site-specific DNA recombinase